MLIGICGGICAGKNAVLDYLVNEHDFQVLHLLPTEPPPSVERPASSQTAVTKQRGRKPGQTFVNINDLRDYATKHWRTNFVTNSVHDESVFDALYLRPFFILVYIDAPVSVRWQRFRDRCIAASLEPPTLETFVLRNDEHFYSPSTGLAMLASQAQIKLLNSSTSLPALHRALGALNLTDPGRLRPQWDHYFMTLANLAARRSNCMRRQVGCVLVRSKRVISTGYNGTPRHLTNCADGGCPRCNGLGSSGMASGGADLSTCLCIHAEENALLEAGRERVGDGAVLYCNTCPCLTCSIKIVQVGITEVVYSYSYHMDAAAAQVMEQAGVKLRQFVPPREGVVNLIAEEEELTQPNKQKKRKSVVASP